MIPSQISLKICARRAARATSRFSSAAAKRLVRTDLAVCRAENWVMKTSAKRRCKAVQEMKNLMHVFLFQLTSSFFFFLIYYLNIFRILSRISGQVVASLPLHKKLENTTVSI